MVMSPTVRHRRLGRELRRLRDAAKLSPEDAARQLGWSRSKLSRVENARLLLRPAEIANACDLYGAAPEAKANLIQLGREAGRRGWWTAFSDVFEGSYVPLEADSSAIATWEPLLIPGLFQTRDYAHAIIHAARPNLEPVDLDRHVAARIHRKVTLDKPDAPTLRVVLDEGALHRLVVPSALMAVQLADILDKAARPHITVQVLPLAAGPHPGLDGAFSVLYFGEEDPRVGYTWCPGGDIFIEAADPVRDLTLKFERLADLALTPKESAELIAAVRSDHEKQA
jgi:transcriptional regulator with XRE-family HTH domain